MKNKILSYVTGAAALATLCVLPTGCIQDDVNGTRETTLTLTFSTRAPGDSPNTTGPGPANEHMRTLRVILTETDGTIRYNTKITGIPQDATDQKVTFSELITVADGTTTFNVYAIANEESFVNPTDQLAATTGNISDMNLENLTLDKEILTKLNQGLEDEYKDNDSYRLPQTAKKQVTVMPEQDNEATIQLEFVVAKVDLMFTNQSPQKIDMGSITFSNMDVATTQLLPLENRKISDEGEDVTLSGITVPANGTYNETFYVYESQVTGNDSYILSTAWGSNSLNLTTAEGGLGKEFTRGTKLDIDITLNPTSITNFNLVVLPWGEINMDVPAFE